jgi:uncharacterized protein (TIGR02391 family)
VLELIARLPTPDSLLACTPTQLDGILLAAVADRIKRSQQDQTAPRNMSLTQLQGMYSIGGGVTFLQRRNADLALTESWQRLMNRGFLMAAVGQSAGVMTLTSKGLEAAEAVNFEEIVVRQSLTREMLHEDLRGSVYDNFAAGHYDTAVLVAFKLVEDAVRKTAAGLSAGLVGGRLMKEAFDKQKGPLRDPSLHPSQQATMPELFAGAMGVFRNPVAHGKVGKSDPATVMEELMIASRLLRFVKP